MKATLVQADKHLIWADVPDPVMKSDEVLVKIEAAALNRADLLQRQGKYPSPPGCPEWMGLEIAGTIVQVGEKAAEKSNWKIGDKVCALLGGGGYAEFVSVKYDMCMPVPKNCSMIEAAAIPEAFATAYLNLFIVWFLTGLWHGASWNFVLWGLYFFIFLVIEKIGLLKLLSKAKILSHIYLALIVYFGWILFRFTDVNSIVNVLKTMFLVGDVSFTSFETTTVVLSNMFILLIKLHFVCFRDQEKFLSDSLLIKRHKNTGMYKYNHYIQCFLKST